MSAETEGAPETLVVGIGQALGGDDAVGLRVVERLRTEGIPARTAADGAALADLLAGADRAVIIDAVVGAYPPGTVIHLRCDRLDLQAAGAIPVSSHGLSVAGAVALARALGGAAEAHVVGVAIDPPRGAATSLSEEVAAAVEVAVLRVRELLRRPLGDADARAAPHASNARPVAARPRSPGDP